MQENSSVESWRNVSGLTPGQREELEQREARLTAAGDRNTETALLNNANRLARENRAAVEFAHLLLPPDSTGQPNGWTEWDTDVFCRNFTGTIRAVTKRTGTEPAAATVKLYGTQYSTGEVERYASATGSDLECMDAGTAREIGAALLAAADELDKLSGDAPPF
jgi:hypothetical protein